MDKKQPILQALSAEFQGWEELLAGLDPAQITTPRLAGGRSIQDEIAHLWAWQQLSLARLEDKGASRPAQFSLWPATLDENSEEDLDAINDWIYQANREKPWPDVYARWKAGFLRLIELGRATPENDLFAPDPYPWLAGYCLADILTGSNEHHQEHRASLQDRLGTGESRQD